MPEHKLPEPFLNLMRDQLGSELPQLLSSLEAPPVISLRTNPKKQRPLPYPTEPVPWHPEGVYLRERPRFVEDPLYHAGAYYVQEASSMLLREAIAQWLPPDRPLRALDLAAAPGGKTTLLAAGLPDGSLLVANEVIRSRFATLQENATRWGATIHLAHHDPRDFSGLRGFFNLLLVDAPCSGEGLFRKNPRARAQWSAEQVDHCSLRQRRILEAAVPLLREGGILIYSTCTFNPRENEEQADWLARAFDLAPLRLDLPAEWGVTPLRHGYQMYPHRVRGEGFYLAGFRMQADRPAPSVPRRFSRLQVVGRRKRQAASAWLGSPEAFHLVESANGRLRALPETQVEDLMVLEAHLKRLWLGRELGQFKDERIVPSHELAMAYHRHPQLDQLELDRPQALQYLRRLPVDGIEPARGWHLATHQGLGLGWIKGVGKRYNNYLPASWRIRSQP